MHVSKRAVLHLTFALLLLCGQSGVLIHSAWHLSRHVHAAPGMDSKTPAPNKGSLQSSLCDLHMVMGSLLAGDCAAASAPLAAATVQAIVPLLAGHFVARSVTTPPVRAPPTLL